MATIEKGSLILVTGITGYIASHVALHCLEQGYRVRGTVRSEAKAAWLHDLFDAKFGKDKFETVVVTDMVHEGAFDEAVKGVSGIMHLASVMTFSDKPDEVIPPTVKGALNILTSATKEPGIKSVLYTSSSTAALLPQPDKVIKVTKDTWDEDAIAKAKGPNPGGMAVYGASKTEAEKAVWQAIKESNPPFHFATILPNANFGPILKPGAEMDSSTASWVSALFTGDITEDVLQTPPQYFIDVRDDAKLHLIALTDPDCNGERIFGFAETYNWNTLLAIFRKQNPSMTFREDFTGLGHDLSQVPNEDAERLLKKHYGHGWTPLEESVAANTATLRQKST